MSDQQEDQEPRWARNFLVFLQSLAIVLTFLDAMMIYLDYITKHHH